MGMPWSILREDVPGCPPASRPPAVGYAGLCTVIDSKETRPKLAPGACGGGGAGPGAGAGGALRAAGPSPPLPRLPPPPWAPRGRSAPSSCCWAPAPAPGLGPGQPHRAWCSPSWPGTRSTRCRTAWEPWSAWTIPRAASPCGEGAGGGAPGGSGQPAVRTVARVLGEERAGGKWASRGEPGCWRHRDRGDNGEPRENGRVGGKEGPGE